MCKDVIILLFANVFSSSFIELCCGQATTNTTPLTSRRGDAGLNGQTAARWWLPPNAERLAHIYYDLSWWISSGRAEENPNWEPRVCRGPRSLALPNGTELHFARFICPGRNDSVLSSFCCGEEDSQYCCTYWDNPGRMVGAIVGLVIAALVLLCCLCLAGYYLNRWVRRCRARRSSHGPMIKSGSLSFGRPSSVEMQPIESVAYNPLYVSAASQTPEDKLHKSAAAPMQFLANGKTSPPTHSGASSGDSKPRFTQDLYPVGLVVFPGDQLNFGVQINGSEHPPERPPAYSPCPPGTPLVISRTPTSNFATADLPPSTSADLTGSTPPRISVVSSAS